MIDSYLKEQQQLKGMQSSKQGMCKGYHLSIEGIRRGYFFVKKWYIKRKGLDLGAEPPGITFKWSLPLWRGGRCREVLGSFSIDDGNGSENVTFKMNFVAFIPIC